MEKVITPSDALAAYERAFHVGSPGEIANLLREMLNVQVAAVESKEEAEKELRAGKKLKTVSVPYGVFLEKSKGKTVYRLNPSAEKKDQDFLVEVHYEEICPNQTYVLLATEAGYYPDKGLTFEGSGQVTGFEDQPEAEVREKTTEGHFQKWEEHARGAWERSERITRLYRPFIEQWVKIILGKNLQIVDPLIWGMRMAVYFHDVGKLSKKWQEVVWQNEQKISGQSRNGYIARTSPCNDLSKRSRPPFHAPLAYPFLQTFLSKILGDYRFLDTIALAAARHHSLEVSGALPREQFVWDEYNGRKAYEWLVDEFQRLLDLSSDKEKERVKGAVEEAAQKVTEGSEADEPPGPTDDFYFLYCLTNRLVKVCDWEDAGGKDIELLDEKGASR